MHNSETLKKEMERRWGRRDVKTELGYCSEYIKDRRDIKNYDLEFYMWLFGAALNMINKKEKELEERTSEAAGYAELLVKHDLI